MQIITLGKFPKSAVVLSFQAMSTTKKHQGRNLELMSGTIIKTCVALEVKHYNEDPEKKFQC